MEKIKVIMMSILMMLVSSVAFAQDNSVRGTVTDNSGEPIIGATIKVKGGAALWVPLLILMVTSI